MKTPLFTLQIIFVFTASFSLVSEAGPASTDPCSGTTCGIGAECRFESNLVLCICSEGLEGDPFVECKPTTVTTEKNFQGSMDFSTTDHEELLKTSPIFNVSPTTIDNTKGHEPTEDDPSKYFPSAPPTLSHYAHSPLFVQQNSEIGPDMIPPTRQVEEYPHDHPVNQQSIRSRPQPTFLGTINPVVHVPPTTEKIETRILPNEVTEESVLASGTRNSLYNEHSPRYPIPLQQNPDVTGSQVLRQGHPQVVQFSTPLPGSNRISNVASFPSSFDSNHPHPQIPPFQLNQEKSMHQRPESIKDPLGIYVDCFTVNNRVVCADASSRHDIPSPQGQAGGFEHRIIAIGNENFNNFQHISPSRPEGFPSPAMKIKPRPEDYPPFQNPGFHNSGPPGTINAFPVPPPGASSIEVKSDGIKVKVEPPVSATMTETKPYAPLPGTDDAKICHQMCGEGAICRLFHGRPICGCPEGHTGDPAKKCFPELNSKFDPNTCQRHTDCSSVMVCLNAQCTDPCLVKSTFDTSKISSFHESLDAAKNKNDNLCGPNTKCTVIEHTPLCSCDQNYFGNPYVGCVP